MALNLIANLSTMFAEFSLEQRFEQAAVAGFRAVEIQFPYALTPDQLARLLADNGLDLALLNAPAGDLTAGERGLALTGGDRFADAMAMAIDYAGETGCKRIHVMTGNGPAGQQPLMERAAESIAQAARQCGPHGIQVLLEALNPHDQPDYFLPSLAHADDLRQMVDQPNVALMLDAYHVAKSGGDPVAALGHHGGHTGHIQLADAADRGEPDSAQMQLFLDALVAMPWRGGVGCEYVARGDTHAGLGWAMPYGIGGAVHA